MRLHTADNFNWLIVFEMFLRKQVISVSRFPCQLTNNTRLADVVIIVVVL